MECPKTKEECITRCGDNISFVSSKVNGKEVVECVCNEFPDRSCSSIPSPNPSVAAQVQTLGIVLYSISFVIALVIAGYMCSFIRPKELTISNKSFIALSIANLILIVAMAVFGYLNTYRSW